jgi:hypothetical protein
MDGFAHFDPRVLSFAALALWPVSFATQKCANQFAGNAAIPAAAADLSMPCFLGRIGIRAGRFQSVQ